MRVHLCLVWYLPVLSVSLTAHCCSPAFQSLSGAQFIGRLAFLEADLLLDINGLLLITERATVLLEHWRVVMEYCTCMRELRFSHKPTIMADFEVLPVMIRGKRVPLRFRTVVDLCVPILFRRPAGAPTPCCCTV